MLVGNQNPPSDIEVIVKKINPKFIIKLVSTGPMYGIITLESCGTIKFIPAVILSIRNFDAFDTKLTTCIPLLIKLTSNSNTLFLIICYKSL